MGPADSHRISRAPRYSVFSPYIIKAIGDPTKLESTLLGNGGYVEILRNFGFKIEIEKSKVSIPKYSKDITNKYIQ